MFTALFFSTCLVLMKFVKLSQYTKKYLLSSTICKAYIHGKFIFDNQKIKIKQKCGEIVAMNTWHYFQCKYGILFMWIVDLKLISLLEFSLFKWTMQIGFSILLGSSFASFSEVQKFSRKVSIKKSCICYISVRCI